MPTSDRAGGLGIYLRTLRRRWALVACIVAAAALSGYFVAKQSTPTYAASSEVLLGQDRRVDALLGTAGYAQDPDRELNTGLRLITLEPIAGEVRRSLDLRESTGALASRVATALDRNSDIVAITARDADPAVAARIANAFAKGYRDYRAAAARASVEDAVAAARARLSGDPSRERDADLHRLEVAAAAQTGGVEIVHRASAATATRRPRPLLSAFVGGFLGLLVAALTIVVLARTDRRIDDEDDLERAAGQPVAGLIPRLGEDAGPATHEALVRLAVCLPPSPEPRVVLITAAGPGEDATDATLGLAAAFEALGRRTVAIEADLRGGAMARRLGAVSTGGLVAVLAGQRTLSEELIELAGVGAEGTGRAWALPAGTAAATPHAWLASDAMAELIADAAGDADVVLLAGAPAGVVADALPLARLADEVVLVARLGATRADDVGRAVRALQGVGAPPAIAIAATGSRRGRMWHALVRRPAGRRGVQRTPVLPMERAEPEVTTG